MLSCNQQPTASTECYGEFKWDRKCLNFSNSPKSSLCVSVSKVARNHAEFFDAKKTVCGCEPDEKLTQFLFSLFFFGWTIKRMKWIQRSSELKTESYNSVQKARMSCCCWRQGRTDDDDDVAVVKCAKESTIKMENENDVQNIYYYPFPLCPLMCLL